MDIVTWASCNFHQHSENSLQVFLLITAFTSTDAATLPDDPQKQSLDVGITRDDRRKERERVKRQSCALRPGGCSIFGLAMPNIPGKKNGETTSKPLQAVLKKN
ncbi:hypothetical protein ACER0C_013021 [Sarotherodon galilaeus]